MSSPSISFSISRQWRDCKLTQSCGLTPKKNPNRAVASIAIRRLPRTTSLIQHPRQDEPPFRVTPSRTCRAPPSLRSQRLQESMASRAQPRPGPGDPAGRRYPDDRIGRHRGRRAYMARSVLDAIIWAERHLASAHFDTRVSPPTRPVPEPVPAPGIPEKSRLCSTQLQKSLFQGQNQR